MPKILWEQSFCVDVPEIDEQHKKWITIINDLHELLLNGADFSESIQDKLLAMRDYGRVHFADEEQVYGEYRLSFAQGA
jgi:hemerythrin